jgi:hypothetical protein
LPVVFDRTLQSDHEESRGLLLIIPGGGRQVVVAAPDSTWRQTTRPVRMWRFAYKNIQVKQAQALAAGEMESCIQGNDGLCWITNNKEDGENL